MGILAAVYGACKPGQDPRNATRMTAARLRRRIEHRAYLKWVDRGGIHGGDLNDWLEAEREEAAGRRFNLADAVADLRLLVEKAEKLDRGSFVAYLRARKPFGLTIDSRGVTRQGPPEESIDAFLFTLRFFIQDNERSSFANIEKLFVSLPLDPLRMKAVQDTRAGVNRHLDSLSNYKIGGESLTRRRILDVFLWGDLAHANRDKRATLEAWARTPFALEMLSAEFVGLLTDVFQAVQWFRDACREAADILDEQMDNPTADTR